MIKHHNQHHHRKKIIITTYSSAKAYSECVRGLSCGSPWGGREQLATLVREIVKNGKTVEMVKS